MVTAPRCPRARQPLNARSRLAGTAAYQGMNWIRQEKRLAIYLRDGLACAWCGASVEQGAKLTLDHIVPHAAGGTNRENNLVTACHRCNSVRADRMVEAFAAATAGYLNHGVTAAEIVAQVQACLSRPLDRAGAKEMIARRGSAARVLADL